MAAAAARQFQRALRGALGLLLTSDSGTRVHALQLYAIWTVLSIGAAGGLLAWWLM